MDSQNFGQSVVFLDDTPAAANTKLATACWKLVRANFGIQQGVLGHEKSEKF
jgi:hypothetical protein